MKRSKFTEDRIIAIPRKQQAGANTAEVCRRQGAPALAQGEGSGNGDARPDDTSDGAAFDRKGRR